jgi:hypothetical protein
VSPAAALLPAVSLLVLSALTHALAMTAADGRLDRNSLVGIRTKATRASDVAWTAGHRAAAPRLRTASRVGYAAAAASIVASAISAAVRWTAPIAFATAMGGTLAVTAWIGLASARANSAARAATADHDGGAAQR